MSVINDKKNRIFQAKQQYIIDICFELIKETSVDQLTMEMIAEAANYTKRTLYVYFVDRIQSLPEFQKRIMNISKQIASMQEKCGRQGM